MKKFFTPTSHMVSVFCGVISFFLLAGFVEKYIAIVFSLLFTLLLMFAIPVALYFNDCKYRNIRSKITEDIVLEETVNIDYYPEVRNGRLLLTDSTLYFFSYDKKPAIEFSSPILAISSLIKQSPVQCVVCFADGLAMTIKSSKSDLIIGTLNSIIAGCKSETS